MLKKLTIEQFVIITRLEINFQPALTVLTGETGAGKSILLGAMGCILGEPGDPEAIRQGSDASVFEACFAPPSDHPVWAYLIKKDIIQSVGADFKIRRTVKREGGEEIKLNDKAVDLEFLHELGTHLVEIHGQFANQSLLSPDNQRNLLDLFGNFPKEIFDNVANALDDVHRYTKELEEENEFLAKYKKQLPQIESLVSKYKQIGMEEGLIERTKEEYARLRTAKETSEAFQAILALLIAGNGVVSDLTTANKILGEQENLDEEQMEELFGYLQDALDSARAAVSEMRRLAPQYEIDTEPLYKHSRVLDVLFDISKEAKLEVDNLYEHFVETSETLERIRNGTERIKELENLLQKAKMAYLHHAHILSQKRVAAGKDLSEAITAELPPLKLNKAEFNVQVEEKPHDPWTEKGVDVVTFKARMNPGMPYSPVAETASGGELARLILGLKVVLQRVQTTPTLVFDEVDTGIGGAAAAAVGERLAQLAGETQVLVITHSPQVASRGKQHLHVSKATDGVTTTSTVNALSSEERIDEICHMLSGDKDTEEARAAAKSLLKEAGAAESRRQQELPRVNEA